MEAREPVKENMGRGTGIGTLIPTCPASTRCWKYLWGMGGDRSEGGGGRGGEALQRCPAVSSHGMKVVCEGRG